MLIMAGYKGKRISLSFSQVPGMPPMAQIMPPGMGMVPPMGMMPGGPPPPGIHMGMEPPGLPPPGMMQDDQLQMHRAAMVLHDERAREVRGVLPDLKDTNHTWYEFCVCFERVCVCYRVSTAWMNTIFWSSSKG